jgi:Spy/CpxP family protein refolding chaperone
MKKISLTVGSIVFIAFLSASFVLAESAETDKGRHSAVRRVRNQGGGPSATGMILRLQEKLGLTDEQVTQLKAIEEKARAAHKAANETAKNEVDAVLTDDQKAQLDELKRSRDEKRQQRRHGGDSDRGRGGRDPQEIFNRIDTNGDGAISYEEFQQHSEQMRNRMGQRGSRGGGQRGRRDN